MKYLLGLALGLATFLPVASAETFTSKPPANYTEQKPDYLYFKDVTVTRVSSSSYQFDVTLYGKVPSNMKDKISFYVGFDIDSNKATGSVSASSPGFGQDIGAWIVKDKGTNRFEEHSGSKLIDGKMREMKLTGAKVSGDKVTFKLRCELFGDYEKSKFFISSTRVQYDKDAVVSDTQVDTLNGSIAGKK